MEENPYVLILYDLTMQFPLFYFQVGLTLFNILYPGQGSYHTDKDTFLRFGILRKMDYLANLTGFSGHNF